MCSDVKLSPGKYNQVYAYLFKLGSGRSEEGNSRLGGHSLGQERLSRARGSDEQTPLGQLSSENRKLVGILKELDQLLEFLFGLVAAFDVVERDGHLLGADLIHCLKKREKKEKGR